MKRIWKWLQSKWFAPVVFKEPTARFIVKSGQKAWECDLATGTITEAKINMIPGIDKKGNQCLKREIVMQPNCLYEFAINGENATRKFEKRILEHYNNHGRSN